MFSTQQDLLVLEEQSRAHQRAQLATCDAFQSALLAPLRLRSAQRPRSGADGRADATVSQATLEVLMPKSPSAGND